MPTFFRLLDDSRMEYQSSHVSDYTSSATKQRSELYSGTLEEEQPVVIDQVFICEDVESSLAEAVTNQETEAARCHRNNYFDDGDDDHSESSLSIPFAEASLATPLLASSSGYENEETMLASAQPIRQLDSRIIPRPEFLYASANKNTLDSSIGVSFKKRPADGAIIISQIKRDSPFYRSGLQVGDRLIALNGLSVMDETFSNMPLKTVANILANSKGTVSLCVHDRNGDPSLVSSSAQKPHRNCKLGISFKTRRGVLIVSKVCPFGLFGHSLLMPNHRAVFINGNPCINMGSQQAADLTAAADRVTIISRSVSGDFATVLSVDGQANLRHRWGALAVSAGVAAAVLGAFGSTG